MILRAFSAPLRLVVLALLVPVFLAACGRELPAVWASEEDVARARYVHDGPPEIALITVYGGTQSGAHAGLLISASERVIFDPAGSWFHSRAPERHDVHYGITPAMLDLYIDFQTEPPYHAMMQRITVTPEVAEAALRIVQSYGPVPRAYCTKSISDVLRRLDGFGHMPDTWFPGTLAEAFATLPGVRTEVFQSAPSAHGRVRAAALQ